MKKKGEGCDEEEGRNINIKQEIIKNKEIK
jgi:hypothetical protein